DPSAIGKEGRPRWTEGHIYPLHDAAGRVREVVLVHEDVTGRRAVEQALADSREMLQVVLNNIPEFVFWKDRDLRYRGCNARFARANGLQAPEDVVGRTDYDFRVLEEEANFFRAVDRRVMDSGRAEHGILEPVHRQDGSLRWLETNKIPLRDGEGQVVGVLGTYQDVTERREAEESRRRLEAERTALLERLQMVLERMPIACMLNDAEFRFTYWNPAAERTFGWRFDEVAGGHPFETITPPASHPAVAEIFRRLAAGDMTAHAIGENRTRDGRTILCDWINTPLNDRQGAFAGILSMAQDVTERVRAEEEVRRLNASLEQRVRERTAELQAVNAELEAFAYSVSHDLRAPLRHIDGFIDLLRKRSAPALDDTGRRYLDVISGSARTMGLLIDQLLAFSRTGRAELSRERVDLGALAEDVVEQLKGETGSRPVSIRVGPLPAVEADPTLLRTVLVNLMGNALKFTRDRDPALVEVGSRPGEAEEVVVFVRDNGVGFDPRFADKLFGVFQRLHRAEEFEGTGIGLASVRRIVQRHGGRTWAEGAPGAGATFYFTLPGSPARPTS
ncbi:MAG TPA: PAS domain S-box protein, partial [Vicinamibacteria bacterium]|nr:PAS domain S-box protein [Vicinamibacteria bacterium]